MTELDDGLRSAPPDPGPRHHLPFSGRTTTCCGRPSREFSRWVLVVNPRDATCPGPTAARPAA